MIIENRIFYILYGSQTGNAESVAKDLSEKLNQDNIINKCMDLNSAKKIPLKDLAKCIIIICSTTGNGDSPENSDTWWRMIKLRSAAKDMFLGIPYAVLGLGDTNYDKYCYMGKAIDKRLSELGGIRSLDLYCADEATNLEETIEAWKIAITNLIHDIIKKETTESIQIEALPEEKMQENDVVVEEINNVTSCDGINSPYKNETLDYLQAYNKLPIGIINMNECLEYLNVASSLLSNSIDDNLLPRMKLMNEKDCIYKFLPPQHNNNNDDDQHSHVSTIGKTITTRSWSNDCPYKANIVHARYLTTNNSISTEVSSQSITTSNVMQEVENWGESRTVIHMEVSIKNANINYSPGDAIGICCPNPRYLVDHVIKILQISHSDSNISYDTSLQSTIATSVISEEQSISSSIGELLSYKYDLTCLPRKASIRILADCCTDSQESLFLKYLCSKGDIGKKLWNVFIEGQSLKIGELLVLFPSCKPTLHQLLSCLTPLPPRYYSIASSPLVNSDKIAVAFSVVRYTINKIPELDQSHVNIAIKRSGMCTCYLENILQPWLNNEVIQSQYQLGIFHKPSLHFHLPCNVSTPLILIGPGTGVAPFIGFLQHRYKLENERKYNNDEICTGMWRGNFEIEEKDLPSECEGVAKYIQKVLPGEIYLFYGCRNNSDYLYKTELEYYLSSKTLTKLFIATSRTQNEKIYVTNKIYDNKDDIYKMIINDHANIYVCGDGNYMAKDVYNMIKKILIINGQFNDESAEEYMQEMKLRRRYVIDIWS